MIRIMQRDWRRWPSEMRMGLRRLTIREESGMLYNVHRIQTEGLAHKTFVLFEQTAKGNVIAGWAMATHDAEMQEYDIMLYVRRDRRRRGYGRLLFNQAKRWTKRQGLPYFFYTEGLNERFFKKVAPEKF